MKLNLLILILSCSFLHFDVKANDTIPPVITLNGSGYIDVILNSVYSDLGATAFDNVDGNITANISTNISATNPNVNLTGTYMVRYIVSDLAGNTDTAIRYVRIFNESEDFATSNSNSIDSCAQTGASFFSYTIIPDSTINTGINIYNFGAFGQTEFVVGYITGYSVGSLISFPANQIISGGVIDVIWAQGTITNLSPITISVIYLWSDGSFNDTCISTYNTNIFLGISDKLKDNRFIIYPNPVHGVTKIESDDIIDNISIYNITGSVSVNKKIENTIAEIDLTGYAPGVYFVRAEFQNSVIAKKIIIE